MLLAARVLQGVGAAIASPTALALITTTFPAGPQRNRAFAVYAAMSGAGAAVGLILGGALTEVDWRWTFFINVPIGIARRPARSARTSASPSASPAGFDLPGAITGTPGLVALVYGLTHAADRRRQRHRTAAPHRGRVLLVAFVVIEHARGTPLMPFRILADRARGSASS